MTVSRCTVILCILCLTVSTSCRLWISKGLKPISNISLWRPVKCRMQESFNRFESARFNHGSVGQLVNFSAVHSVGKRVPPSFLVLHHNMLLGNGPQTFEKASRLLLSFKAINTLPNVQIVKKPGQIGLNSTMATLTQFYNTPVWSLNPCRVVSYVRCKPYVRGITEADPHNSTTNQRARKTGALISGLYSEVVFSTLEGHLIAGEEAMRVYTERKQSNSVGFPVNIISPIRTVLGIPAVGSQDKVYFEVASYSKGGGLLGMLCMPLIRPLQRRFLTDCGNAMCSAVNATL